MRLNGLAKKAKVNMRLSDADAKGLRLFPIAEESKRHLVRDLTRLGFATRPKESGEPATVGRRQVCCVDHGLDPEHHGEGQQRTVPRRSAVE